MAASGDFGSMMPGLDFLQTLMKSAGTAMPGMGPWVTPTLDPQELDKRISDLRTVQFWLEQNAKLLGTTIQALEVQRMTLSTLRSMNLSVADLGEAFKLKDVSGDARPGSPAAARPRRATAESNATPGAATAEPAARLVDPVQWWTALTQQFSEIAATAVRDSSAARTAAANASSDAAAPPKDKPAPDKPARRRPPRSR
jgi:hypothetical protein